MNPTIKNILAVIIGFVAGSAEIIGIIKKVSIYIFDSAYGSFMIKLKEGISN